MDKQTLRKWAPKIFAIVFGSLFIAGAANKIIDSFSTAPLITLDQIESMYAQGQHPEAIKAVELLQQQQPNPDSKAILIASNIHRSANDYNKAIAVVQEAITRKPESRLYEQLGLLYSEQGQDKKAETALQEAIKLDPANALALNNLGIIYLNRSQYLEAETHFKQAIAKVPGYAEAYRNLGLVYVASKNQAGAKQNLELYLKLRPQAEDAEEIRKLVG